MRALATQYTVTREKALSYLLLENETLTLGLRYIGLLMTSPKMT